MTLVGGDHVSSSAFYFNKLNGSGGSFMCRLVLMSFVNCAGQCSRGTKKKRSAEKK